MNIFIIPSWYPSREHPIAGIFIKEHALMLAHARPELNIGLSTWGSHDERLLLKASRLPLHPLMLMQSISPETRPLAPNCVEYFQPAFTWTRKVLGGNMGGIVRANEANLQKFERQFGKTTLIHAYVAHPGGYVAMRLSQKYRLPFVITEEMSPFPLQDYGTPEKLSGWVNKPYQAANANIAVSRSLLSKMQRSSIPRLTHIPNFIDDDFFILPPGRASEKVSFLFVGRLEPQKGVDILIEAVSLVAKAGVDDIHIVVGGSGSLERFLKYSVANYGLESYFSWAGELSREKVRQQMADCDILVLPSRHETFGIVVAEAMACGKPVVATRCGGPEELVTPETGLLVPPENPEELARAIMEIRGSFRTYEPAKIRTHCLDRFSKAVVAHQLATLYSETISGSSR